MALKRKGVSDDVHVFTLMLFHDLAFEYEKYSPFLSLSSSGGFEKRPFVRGLQGRSISLRVPTKQKDSLSNKFPMRWSLGSKERRKPEQVSPRTQDTDPAELVQYLQSGRRPQCTKDSIVNLMNESRSTKKMPEGRAASVRSSNVGSMSCVGKGGDEGEGRRSSSRTSLPNGAAGGRTGVEGSKSNGLGRRDDELANGKLGSSTANIRRSKSSSNIPSKAEQSIRRTVSLHRNGMSTTPAPSRSVTTDKPSYSNPQRTRYSTTSLGRKKTFPESSF
ncbi:hypothetical protein GOODEAATRI_011709 [Goodea atripinnis]|uniref:Uncharacterized protein n=1 Tax=Goodea atripinnis TaxID=208336 RepID=A0ABV0PDA4_9TELE